MANDAPSISSNISIINRSKVILISIGFLLKIGCVGSPVYDPPLEGKDIFIHNQTGQFIFFTDSLPNKGYLMRYDTILVNSKPVVQKNGNYIPGYDQWLYFLSESKLDFLRRRGDKNIPLYFIKEADIFKPCDEIKKNRFYTVFYLEFEAVTKNLLNHLFYFNDSIYLTHDYNISQFR